MKHNYLTILFLLIGFYDATAQWELRYPSLPEDKITAVNFISESVGFFVNEAGAIYKTTNGGQNWSEVFYNRNFAFTDIQFVDDQLGFAYGSVSTSFTYTTNGGESWNEDDLDVQLATSVIGFSSSEFLKVDEKGIYKTISIFGDWDTLYTIPTEEIDGGDHFYEEPIARPQTTWNYSDSTVIVWMYNWYKDEIENDSESDSLNYLLVSNNRGNSWDSVWVDVDGKFHSLKMANSQTGYLLTENSALHKTTNGGAVWEEVSFSKPDQSPNNFTIISEDHIYLQAGRDILKTMNGGETWETINVPEDHGLNYIISKYNLSALYYSVLKVDEDSEEWIEGKKFLTVHGSKLHFKNELEGWVYSGGTPRKTEDGGYSWVIDNSFPTEPFEMLYTDYNTGWIFGSEDVYKTENAGETWTKLDIFASEESIYDNHILFEGENGVLYGNVNCEEVSCGIIMVSSDGGDSWNETKLPATFKSVSFSKGRIFGVGDGKMLWLSSDMGASWKVAYDFSFENLSSKALVRSAEDMVWLNIGFETLAYSKDGGETWGTTSAEADQDMALIGPFHQGNYYLYVPNHGNVLQINSDLDYYDKRDQLLHTKVGIEDIEYVLDEDNIPHIWLKGIFNSIFYQKGGLKVTVSAEYETVEAPKNTALHQNFPNPFNPTTTFSFDLEKPGNAKLSIFDMTGREVAVIQNNNLSAGSHSIHFNAQDLASGTYIYRLKTADKVISRKFTLIK